MQGATKSMVIDHGYLLEGQYAHELPEVGGRGWGRCGGGRKRMGEVVVVGGGQTSGAAERGVG